MPKLAIVPLVTVAAATLGFLFHHPAAPLGLEHPAWFELPLCGLMHWDANWYREIAVNGYWYRPGQQSPVAFFPGFPLSVRALSAIGLSVWASEALVSFVCGAGALLAFRRWASHFVNERVRDTATWALALYPFAFFLFGVGYADSLFLLLVCSAFLCVEEDRLPLAALLGALATFCRPAAPAVVLGLLACALEKRRRAGQPLRPRDFLPALSGLGAAAYMLYLGATFGDPAAFAHVQSAPGWDQPFGLHTALKISFIDAFRSGRLEPDEQLRLVGHAAIAGAAVLLLVPTWRRLPRAYALYCGAAIGLPILASKDFIGFGRYAIAAFPLFLTLALLLEEKRPLRLVWWPLSAGLLVFLAFQFGGGAYLS
ncbi:MAG: hypothetical protein JNK82_30960 [Myxococcaceae bacterium]|nr:hypothetical protein [Myxococcaceae bacterium]